MKKLIMGMAAVSVLAIAAPAAAQTNQGGYVDSRVEARIGQLQSRIQAGVQQGSIDRREAQSLRTQLRELGRLERLYARDGISGRERQDLQNRIQSLRGQIRSAEMSGGGYGQDDRWTDGQRFERDCPPGLEKRNNGCTPPGQVGRDGRWEDRRADRDDRRAERWDDRDDRDDRWEDRDDDREIAYDRDRDGYDDRDTNRDRRVDSRDGVYQERESRGGIGGIIDRVTGGGGLRVGQRVSGGLYALPDDYRDQFRDGTGAYHRTDGRNIYRIDARTDVVLQVYAMRR